MWAQRSRDKTRVLGRVVFVTCLAGQARGLDVELVGKLGQLVITLGNRGGTKGVGLNNIRSRGKVLFVNLTNHIRPCKGQKLVVAFDVLAMLGKARTTELLLRELVALDHGSHRTIEDQDAFLQHARKFSTSGVGIDGVGKAGIGHGARLLLTLHINKSRMDAKLT